VSPDDLDIQGAPLSKSPEIHDTNRICSSRPIYTCTLSYKSMGLILVSPEDLDFHGAPVPSPQKFTKLTGNVLIDSCIDTHCVINQLDQSLCRQTTSSPKGLQYQSRQKFPQRILSDFQYQIGTQIFPGIRVGKGDLNRQ